MFCHQQGRSTRFARASVAASVSLVLGGAPAFAHTQAKSDGGPISGGETVGEPTADSPVPGGDDESRNSSRRVKSAAPILLDTRVTVRVKGVPLSTFLDTISAQAKVNFIITEGLEQKRVTAFLQNVTVRDALQVLLEIKGLTYQQMGKSNTYVVTERSKEAANLVTRIYPLSFIPLIPLETSDLGDSASGASSGMGGMGGAGVSRGAGASRDTGDGGGGGGGPKPCASKNQRVSVTRVICTVLSKDGDIEVEPRTNSLIITDIPESFPQVEQIISELDKKAPQVMIEAQIVEIDSDRTRNLGFEWGGTNGELGTFTAGQRDTSFPLNMPKNLGNMHFFDPLSPTGGVISSLAGGGGASSGGSGSASAIPLVTSLGYLKTSVLDLSQLQITLRALVQRSEGRFLGKPKIMTLNNKTATIEIASSEAVAVQTNQSSAGGSTGLQSTSAERFETGVILKVTPQVNKEGYITMLLQPSFTDVQRAAISTASNPIFNPVKRQAITLVRVKNGQTLVLGGLLRSVENKIVRKVPFLGYIPLLGWFFTSESNSRQNTDLVIFITPTIVSD